MMSPETIRAVSRKAARESARNKVVPLLVEREDMDERLGEYIRGLPFIGYRTPRGYKKLDTYFVDNSGFGREGEPALTFGEFCEAVRKNGPGCSYAILEAGQFQVVIGLFSQR